MPEDDNQMNIFQASPFYVPKMPPYMASSLNEKSPMGIKVDHENFRNQRAFTPLDQFTTAPSLEEETHPYNLSGHQYSYSFTHSNDQFNQ